MFIFFNDSQPNVFATLRIKTNLRRYINLTNIYFSFKIYLLNHYNEQI